MRDATLIIAIHQLLFQGMFFAKNIALGNRLGRPIRGYNLEASISIGFFAVFIGLSLWLAQGESGWGMLSLLPVHLAQAICLLVLAVNLAVAAAALQDLGDSWRVGVIEEQRTSLVESGIYRFSRNPYFVSYMLMFVAYTILLQSTALLALSLIGFALIHWMVRREEKYLARLHPREYVRYCQRVPRYLIK